MSSTNYFICCKFAMIQSVVYNCMARVDPDNIKGRYLELRQGRQNRKSWEDPTNLVQSLSMGFLSV